MGGSHCVSRPFPLSGQVAIFGIAAWPQETTFMCSSLVDRRVASNFGQPTSICVPRLCNIAQSPRTIGPVQEPARCSVKPTCNTRRAMAQMCYVEKWKLADVLDIARRRCAVCPRIVRIREKFKILGSKISGNQ